MERTATLRDQLTAGLVAGVTGAIVIEAFLFVMWLRGVPTALVLGLPAWTPGGIVAQVLVSVAWACGYAYLSRSEPQLVRRPAISGAVYGAVVYGVMAMLSVIEGGRPPSAPTTIVMMLGYVVFFGIPVAAIVSRVLRRA